MTKKHTGSNDDGTLVIHHDDGKHKKKPAHPHASSSSIPTDPHTAIKDLQDRTKELALAADTPQNNQPALTIGAPAHTQPQDIGTRTPEVQTPAVTTMPPKNNAADLVRNKINQLYNKEPDAQAEAMSAASAGDNRSNHQQFVYELTNSGKSLAQIQTEWHKYYVSLPDSEKSIVWKEFYTAQSNQQPPHQQAVSQSPQIAQPAIADQPALETPKTTIRFDSNPAHRTAVEVKEHILETVSAGGKLGLKDHIKSLVFGVGIASVVGLGFMFTFFNEFVIAPFISPSQQVSATPIIGQNAEVGPESKIIIPKINLEVPVVFGMDTIVEEDVQEALEDGVVHYATTPQPGEQGNSVIVGHSSNNILNSGRYKFAFVLLRRLEPEDVFFVHRDGIRYTYKVYRNYIVPPSDVSVLQTQDRPNTMTLITCDPPGTTVNRRIVLAEQISPDPTGNTASTAIDVSSEELISTNEQLPSNAPSLWSRLWPF